MERCAVCNRNPERMNSEIAECSHVDCPHRERCWSNGTGPAQYRPINEVEPLEPLFDKQEV